MPTSMPPPLLPPPDPKSSPQPAPAPDRTRQLFRVYLALPASVALGEAEGELVRMVRGGLLVLAPTAHQDHRDTALRHLLTRWRVGYIYDLSDRCLNGAMRATVGEERDYSRGAHPPGSGHTVEPEARRVDPHDDPNHLSDADLLTADARVRARLAAETRQPGRRRAAVYRCWVSAAGEPYQRGLLTELRALGFVVRDATLTTDLDHVRYMLTREVALIMDWPPLTVPPCGGPRRRCWREALNELAARLHSLREGGVEIPHTRTAPRPPSGGPVPYPLAVVAWRSEWLNGTSPFDWQSVAGYYDRPNHHPRPPVRVEDRVLDEMAYHYAGWLMYHRAGEQGYNLVRATEQHALPDAHPAAPVIARITAPDAPPNPQGRLRFLAEMLTSESCPKFCDLHARLGLESVDDVIKVLCAFRTLLHPNQADRGSAQGADQ